MSGPNVIRHVRYAALKDQVTSSEWVEGRLVDTMIDAAELFDEIGRRLSILSVHQAEFCSDVEFTGHEDSFSGTSFVEYDDGSVMWIVLSFHLAATKEGRKECRFVRYFNEYPERVCVSQ